MAQPVLVRTYAGRPRVREHSRGAAVDTSALPPISAYAFADILRAADGQEFQTAIDGIAEICAKNKMSLADEYGSHLPPLGEITAAMSSRMRPHLFRPGGGMRRVLTSVPEASSGSSEGSGKSKKRRRSLFAFRQQDNQDRKPPQRIRIAAMGRTIPVGTATALAAEVLAFPDHTRNSSGASARADSPERMLSPRRAPSAAVSSLYRLLEADRAAANG